ncbi:MAG: NAD-binding protein [Chloroflexota bacterium]
MKIIVVGCGRLGSELIYRLFQHGHEITVVDVKPSAFDKLPPDFIGRLNEGDAMNQEVLHRAGIEQAEALAAVTSSDAINLVIGHIASQIYHVPKIVARNFEPNCCSIFDCFGMQMIASSSWGAQRLEEMLYQSDVRSVFSAGNGEVEIYELTISAMWAGHPLIDILTVDGCIVAALTRAGRAILPQNDTILGVGDIIHVSATFEGIDALRYKLGVSPKE